MDSDSSLPPLLISLLVFCAFLLVFISLAFAEPSRNNVRIQANARPLLRRLLLPLSPYKYACIIALTLSGLALAMSLRPLGWWPVTGLALVLLILVTVIERSASAITGRRPNRLGRRFGFLPRALFGQQRQRSGGGAYVGLEGNIAAETGSSAPLEFAEPEITEEELVGLDQRNREMLRSILRLDVSTAREAMVPRLDMVAVEINSPLSDVVDLVIESGHSRIPVYEETIDSILGVVHSRDLLAELRGQPNSSLRQVMRPAFFIPETKRLDDLLQELQQKAIQLAIVVDEYGGTEGLVTMEDLLEEIVGEIEDEFSRSEEPVTRMPDGSVVVDAGITTEDVKGLFGTELHDPDIDTVGGYVYRALGRIPEVGDFVYTDHLSIEVIAILGRRIRKLRIKRVEGDTVSEGTAPS